MNGVTKKKFFYIDSDKRVSGTSSDFSYRLDMSENDHFDTCSVLQASIPFTFYMVRDGFNTFQLKETGNDAVLITIPKGNYNINSFKTIVGPLITTASPTGSTYAITYPASFTETNTNFLTITITAGAATDSQLIFDSSNTLHEQFGFDKGSTNTFDGTSIVSDNATNYIINRSLLIHADIVDGGSSNVLQEIYSNNSQINGNIVYQSSDALAYSKPLKLGKQNVINIYLSDVNGVKVDLNGQDMNITLLMYKRNKTFEIVEQFIEFAMLNISPPEKPVTPVSELPPIEEEKKEDKKKVDFTPLDFKSKPFV
tara:strand:+ start:1074 stop:2009 length:936 start_codon:yes stop_codon:yes gene_type:complete